ncbi:MFS transporter [Roseomonas terrae]|jgi:predicted MFS family arabinose efflux permease|uniref:MFS transporter n=1 Tax=Neoroseomonas terrae TaxID=424799 RepID=A0ABS5EPB3_9PROT|nr:MFS transporter [Neoroseomonas terrae]MBR0652837.1 MFS transporter [Neoroseomonas terrae]
MLAAPLAAALARRGIHYGWVMVSITFLIAVSSAGALGVLGALLLPLQRETGWDMSSLSGALALRLLLYGLMAPFAAALLQRYGLRRMVVLALGFVVAGLLLSTGMTQVWELWLYWGVVTGIGTGMTALVLGATVANRWFVARRGLVLGLLTAANATGQLAFLPLGAWLAQEAGWRPALLPGLIACGLAAALVLLFGRDRPSDLGLPAYGEDRVAPPSPPAGNPVRTAFAVLAEAAQTRVFWILFVTFMICGLSTNGLMQTHFIPLCADFGMAEVQAASVLALIGIFDFMGTIGSGWLSDRYDNRKLLFWYYGLRGLSLLWLPSSTFSLYGLALFAVFYGLDWIATVPPTVKLAGAAFGREKAPIVFGWVFTGHQLGAAMAAMLGGLSRDVLSSYLPAFYLAGAACLVAAVLALGARRRPVVVPAAAE